MVTAATSQSGDYGFDTPPAGKPDSGFHPFGPLGSAKIVAVSRWLVFLTTVEKCEGNRRADEALAMYLSQSGSTPPTGSRPRKWGWAPSPMLIIEYGTFTITYKSYC